jgi:hypothetical protein
MPAERPSRAMEGRDSSTQLEEPLKAGCEADHLAVPRLRCSWTQNGAENDSGGKLHPGCEAAVNLSNLLICGLSFHQTPVEVRERVSIPPHRLEDALSFLTSLAGVRECMALSTCNRNEIYLAVENWVDGKELFCRFARAICGTDLAAARDTIYSLNGPDAVKHSFRVAGQ